MTTLPSQLFGRAKYNQLPSWFVHDLQLDDMLFDGMDCQRYLSRLSPVHIAAGAMAGVEIAAVLLGGLNSGSLTVGLPWSVIDLLFKYGERIVKGGDVDNHIPVASLEECFASLELQPLSRPLRLQKALLAISIGLADFLEDADRRSTFVRHASVICYQLHEVGRCHSLCLTDWEDETQVEVFFQRWKERLLGILGE
ncbi:MAG: hypothetical protein AB7K09_14720 [Planctomycetota bacterium]